MAKILAVDDSPSIRQLMSSILSEAGHEVITAEDGLAGLRLTREHEFDMILADVHMPGLDGIAMVSRIRKQPGYEYTPIVMVTTEIQEEKKKKAKSHGASGWLTKPFTSERVISAVNKLIG